MKFGIPNWTRQYVCPAKTVDCRNGENKGHYGKICRLPSRIQHVDQTTSSAEEDNWGYDKFQSKNNKKESDYIYVTLLVNSAPMIFIIDSGSPVTLIPQDRSNSFSKVEKLNNNCKDVNDNKIEFVGQTKATVKSNKTTLQLPLLNTEANNTPLMGLDRM